MRATVGILGILGFSVAVASAQAPTPPPQRRAVLLPPQAIYPSEVPTIARAAAEELPSNPAMTPVPRPTGQSATPGWLTGSDTNFRPAAGTGSNSSNVRPLTPRNGGAREEAGFVNKGMDKLRETFGKGARPEQTHRAPGQLPAGVAAVTANANTPFRGTAPNGAPVYAGPPAYRWYGWGSVTPGANPYAPTGQYPPASANWFSITGATPGAFPVPVTHPDRPAPGTEPPVYVPVHGQRMPAAWNGGQATVAAHGFSRVAETAPHPATELPRVEPRSAPRATPTPTITPPPPIVLPPITPTPIVIPGTTDQEPPIRPIGTASPEVPLPVVSPGEANRAANGPGPAPLPVSATEEKSTWQPTSGSNSPNDWSPADGRPRSQAVPIAPAGGAAGVRTPGQPVARAQIEDSRPDPTLGLVRALCHGRATGLDVRWAGEQKLRVTFDCRTAAAAQQLVKDISSRPELARVAIEFSVIVR